MEKLDELKCLGTFSITINTYSYLWGVLSRNTPLNHWQAAVNEKKWVASSHTILDKTERKIVYQRLLSNAFNY